MKTAFGTENHLCEPLSHALQAELFARIIAGDNTPNVEVRNGSIQYVSPRDALILSNQRAVYFVAVSVFPAARDDEFVRNDLLQAGTVGLLKALDRWDPTRANLYTYAYWKVRWECQKVVAGLRPVSRSKWKYTIAAVALDATDEEGQSLADTIAAPQEPDRNHEEASAAASESVPPMLDQCNPTARQIVEQRIIKGRPWRKVARLVSKKLHRKVSVDYCQRVCRDTLSQLRARIEETLSFRPRSRNTTTRTVINMNTITNTCTCSLKTGMCPACLAKRDASAKAGEAIEAHYFATTTPEQRAAERARSNAHYEDWCIEHQSGGGGW